MKVNEKIRFLRESNNWSQEDMAEKLGMSVNGYSKIERGETKLTMTKLEQIVNVLNIDLIELISFGERNVVYFKESGNNHSLNIINPTSQEMLQELVGLQKTVEHQEEIIQMQKMQIETLQELVNSLRKNKES